MKRSKNFFEIVEKDNGVVFWNGVLNKTLGENSISTKNDEYDINPDFQAYFSNKKYTSKSMDNEGRLTVFKILNKMDFYSMIHNKGLSSARMKDAINNLPKAIAKIRNPSLPTI